MSIYHSSDVTSLQGGANHSPAREDYFLKKHQVSVGDINVYVGENIRECTKVALRKAAGLAAEPEFANILVLNTGSRQRWVLHMARETDSSRIGDQFSKPVCVMGTPCGDLCNRFEDIREKIVRHEISLVIINSWEFASRDARYKEKLLFQLHTLVEELGITVLIFSYQTNVSKYSIGKLTRGGLGKLSVVAGLIRCLEHEDIEDEMTAPLPKMAVRPEKSSQFISSNGWLDGKPKEVAAAHIEEEEAVLEDDLVAV